MLELSHRDYSNEWSNIEFGEEITQVELIEVNLTHLNWSIDIRFNASAYPRVTAMALLIL